MRPNYTRPSFSPDPKPAITGRIERRQRSKDRKTAEDRIKDAVRKRDKRCRYPDCPMCRAFKNLTLEVAHVLQAKGMGGDKRLVRSQRQYLMLLDAETHRRQEQHRILIVPIDAVRGTDGPCEFWAEDERQQLVLVAREIAPGGPYERD